MEQKLAAMRNLLIFMIALLVIIGGMLIYQNRLIDRNREELNDIRRDAIELVVPTLNQRLKTFDARLERSQAAFDGIDGKIKDAEDRFMKRINQELPAMLDRELPKILNKYIDEKLREIKRFPNQQQ
jgi:Rad3-related DNA helicase